MPGFALTAAARRLRTLGRDRSGLAMMEFAFSLPVVLLLGGGGIELSFVALTNLRVSQFALTLADNASRVGIAGTGGVTLLREADINDVLQGTRLQGQSINLTTNGRVTITSLEKIQQTYSDHAQDLVPVQRIHWQRCMGTLSGTGYDSIYPTSGTLPTTAATDTAYANRGVDAAAGIGSPTVNAITNSGVMFVEVSYRYKPAFGTFFVNTFNLPTTIHYSASFIVRDNRDFTHLYPTPNFTPSTCDKHNA